MTNNAKERDELIQFLSSNKIQSRPIWTLMHTLVPYAGTLAYKIEKATYYHDKIVNIPCSTCLTKEEVKWVSEKINEWRKNG